MTVITADTGPVDFSTPNETIIIISGVTTGTVLALTGDTGSLLENYGRILNAGGSGDGVLFGPGASGQIVNKPGGVIDGELRGIRV
jgi:hypothetical protein